MNAIKELGLLTIKLDRETCMYSIDKDMPIVKFLKEVVKKCAGLCYLRIVLTNKTFRFISPELNCSYLNDARKILQQGITHHSSHEILAERHIADWLGKNFPDITVDEVKTDVERQEHRGADDEDLRSEYDKGLFV